MKKNLTTMMLATMIILGTNTAFSACPCGGCPQPPKMVKGDCTCPACTQRAEFEKKRIEFEKLSPAEREQKMKEIQKQRIEEFETKLNLTEAQKAQAKEIRMKGHEQIKPVIEQIKLKKQEIRAVRMSKISAQEQERKIKELKAQIKPLKIKADKLRKQNLKEFEDILTPAQKATLEEMKKNAPRPHHHRPMPPRMM